MAPKEDPKDTVTVNVEEFTKTRDSVVYSLLQLQNAVAQLSNAYLNHSNTVLGHDFGPDLSLISNNLASTLLENGLLGARTSSPGVKSESGEKKKRKRAPPDPNAPKRALTPFFLYMQHNRAIIGREMGPEAKPKEVAEEGTRRWADMSEPQKEVWKKLYADNLAVYKEKVKAYKAGLPYGGDDDRAADQLQQGVAAAETSDVSEEEEEEEEQAEEEEESSPEPEPVKEPTPPRSTKRRRSEARATKEVSSPVETKKKKNESPEKKTKKATAAQKEKEEPASGRKSVGGAEAKRSKKKRKSEVGADE